MKTLLIAALSSLLAISAFSQTQGVSLRSTNGVAFGTLTVQGHIEGTNTAQTNTIYGRLQTGSGTVASSLGDFAYGINNRVSSQGSMVGGAFNTNGGQNSFALGVNNTVQSGAPNSISSGSRNSVSGQNAYVGGESNLSFGRDVFLHGRNITMNGGIAGSDNNFVIGRDYTVDDGCSNSFIWSTDDPSLIVGASYNNSFFVHATNQIYFTGAPVTSVSGFIGPFYGSNLVGSYVGVSGASPYTVSNLWSVVLPDGATAFQLGNPGAGYASIFATNLIVTPDGLHYTLFTDGTNSFFGGDLYLTNSTFHGKSFRPTKVAMTVVGATAQSTNLVEIQDGSSNVLASVTASGVFTGNGAGLTNIPPSALATNLSGSLLDGSYLSRQVHPPNVVTGMVFSTVITNANYNAFPGLAWISADRLLVSFSSGSAHASDDRALYYSVSSNHGVSWQSAVLVYDDAEPTNSVSDSALSALRDGSVLLSSTLQHGAGSGGTTNCAIAFKGYPTNSDGTVSWTAPIVVSNGFGTYSFAPSPAVYATNGVLWQPIYGYSVATDNHTSVAVVPSYDHGLTWSNMVYIAHSVALDTNGWSEAELAVLDDGRLFAVIRRDFGIAGYAGSWSSDGGFTWSTPVQLLSNGSQGRPTLCKIKNGGLLLLARAAAAPTRYSVSWDSGTNWTAFLPWRGSIGGANDFDAYSAAIPSTNGGILSVIATADSSSLVATQAWIVCQEWYDAYGAFNSGGTVERQVTADIGVLNTNLAIGFSQTIGYTNPPSYGLTVKSNVGVGTSSPSARLHVVDTANASQLRLDGGGAQGGGVDFYNSISGSTRRNWGLSTETFVAGDLAFRVGTAAGTAPATSVMEMLSSGNVGIGTSSISNRLHILDPNQLWQLRVDGGNANGSGMLFYNSLAGATRRNWGIATEVNAAGDFVISHSVSAGGSPAGVNTTAIQILNDGSVGVGTISPNSKLDVNGGAFVQSLTITNSTFPTDNATTNGQTSGQIWYGGTSSNAHTFFGNLFKVNRSFVMGQSVVLTDTVVSNSATGGKTNIYTIPMAANYLTVGKVLETKLDGLVWQNNNAATLVTVQAWIDSTNLLLTVPLQAGAAITAGPVELTFMFTCRSIGSGTSASVVGRCKEVQATTSGGVATTAMDITLNPVTFDSTVNNTINITVSNTVTGGGGFASFRLQEGRTICVDSVPKLPGEL